MSMCINPSIPCMSPIAKNYSLVLNFTPYFHEHGVNYSFGKNPSEGSAYIKYCFFTGHITCAYVCSIYIILPY